MANTTSGTTTFDRTFSIDEIIEESFERIGLNSVAGYQMKSARRSLNILFQEWGNRGIHYWEIAETNIDMIEGQAEYKFFRSSDEIKEHEVHTFKLYLFDRENSGHRKIRLALI